MEPFATDDFSFDPGLSHFRPERRDDSIRFLGLRCACGGEIFHVSGWPRDVLEGGGFFWRSVMRIFREARRTTESGEPLESPFLFPIYARCDACGRETKLPHRMEPADAMPGERREEPRESYRCRVCRRGSVALVVGEAIDDLRPDRADHEVVVRCEACHRQARLAWSKGRPNERELRLDTLYGRR